MKMEDLDNPRCHDCGHTKFHHFFTKKRSGINSHITQPKDYNKMCDVKHCKCSGFKVVLK